MVSSKINKIVYFYAYFVPRIFVLVIHTYLPILFFKIFNINEAELAFIQIFSYIALFMKPIASFYFDKPNIKLRIWAIFSALCLIVSFSLLIINLSLLILFGILLGFTFGFISISDVAIDKIILKKSNNEVERKKNARWMQSGTLFGTIIGSLIYIIVVSNPFSMIMWNKYFMIVIVGALPLIPLIFLINDKTEKINEPVQVELLKINKKSVLILGLFVFLFNAGGFYQWALEPWILDRFGSSSMSIYSMGIIILVLIELIGIIIAGSRTKWNNKKVLSISMVIDGIIYMIVPFLNFLLFFILLGVAVLFAGFIAVSMVALNLNISKHRAVAFQTISSFGILGQVIFTPLGTFLSGVILVEFLIIIAGTLFMLAGFIILLIQE